jgi:hypothetical protein
MQSISNARRDGLLFLLLGCAVLVSFGPLLERISPVAMIDFKLPYYSTRCLLNHSDPYDGVDVIPAYRDGGEVALLKMVEGSPNSFRLVYFPTIFPFVVPFALLPFGVAHIIWLAFILCGLILASFLIWNTSAGYAPVTAGFLIGFMLANSELVVMIGNPAGIAISLCVVAAWCFVKDTLAPLGVVCLAVGLLLKPHDVGMVWLYFLLAGRVYRKRALQSLAVVIVVGLPSVLWVSHVAPNWTTELHSTLLSNSAHGHPDDPGPTSSGAHQLGMMVNLQTALSAIKDDPSFYDPVSYVVCGALLFAWCLISIKGRPTPTRTWLALAAIAALTMLPLYHRQVDTKLLLLTVPACARLCSEGKRLGRVAFIVTFAGFVLTGDVPWVIVLHMISHLRIPNTEFLNKIIMAGQMCPVPLILLLICVFYLYVYAQRTFAAEGSSRYVDAVQS